MCARLFRTCRGKISGLLLVAGLLGFAANGQAATLTADFNGDGISDRATLTAASGVITIVRGGGRGTTTYYTSRNWMTASVSETNGIVGQELVFTFSSGYVDIIDDRARTSRDYVTPDIRTVGGSRVLYLTDLNGVSGREVLFVYPNGALCLVDDRGRGVRCYAVHGVGFGGPRRYVYVGELNGVAGSEIIFSYMGGVSLVVDDRRRTIRDYAYLTSGGAPRYANVDGAPGLEAIFDYQGVASWIVDRIGEVVVP